MTTGTTSASRFTGDWADPAKGGITPAERAARILVNAYVRPIYAEDPRCSDEHYYTAERPADWKANVVKWPRSPEDNADGTVSIGGITNISGHDRQHLPVNWMRALAKQAGLTIPIVFAGQKIDLQVDVVARAILGSYCRRVVGILRNYFISHPGYTDSWRAEGKTIETVLNAIECGMADPGDLSDYRTFFEANLLPAYTSGYGTPLPSKGADFVAHSPGMPEGYYYQPNELTVIVPALYRLAKWMDASDFDTAITKKTWDQVDRHASLTNSAVGPNGETPDFVGPVTATPSRRP